MSDLREAVEKTHLAAAQSSINNNDRYWFFDARPSANMLATILKEIGYEVILHELGPDWEHVVSLASKSVSGTIEAAELRAAQRENGVPEASLPK